MATLAEVKQPGPIAVSPSEETRTYALSFGIVALVMLLIIIALGATIVTNLDGWRTSSSSVGPGLTWTRTSGDNPWKSLTSNNMRFALWSDGYAYVINTTTGQKAGTTESDSSQVGDNAMTATQLTFTENWLELWNSTPDGNPIGVAAATWVNPPQNDGPISISLLPNAQLWFTTKNFGTPVIWQPSPPLRKSHSRRRE
jgi:hypothetical protein